MSRSRSSVPELADDPRFVQRFEAEAQLVARLEHPHVVPLYDFWRQPGRAYLVFRLLRGGSLEDLITEGPVTLERATRILDEIGGALTAAHALGVVHRDVKPGNVLFDELGNSYLADFGISVALDTDEQVDMRSAGSPLYASPEQARDGVAGTASDQYSLGVLLWEALTGQPPFAGSSSTEVLRAKLGVPVPPVTECRSDLPGALDAVLQRATAPHPTARYENITELARAWHGAIAIADTARETGRLPDLAPSRTTSQTVASVRVGGTNPYKGLRAFREADASEFEGRRELAAGLAMRVAHERFIAVVGPSGSGKSSLVHAGLVPALRRDDALVVSMVPGTDPLTELEAALLRVTTTEDAGMLRERLLTPDGLVDVANAGASEGAPLVIIVDQFEELWTLVESDRARERFIDLLVRAARSEAPLRVVVTLRADLYDRPLQHPDLGPIVRDTTFAVTPMSAAELHEAVVVPAERVGVRFEPGLVATIVDDVISRAGALPLLQFTLTELYERRTNATVTAASYTELGGVGGSLASRAEQLYEEVPATQRSDVRRLFTQLVALGDEGDNLRRRATMPELADVAPEVIDVYRTNRLLVLDRHPLTREPTIEVAHEALLREWPRLREWIDEDRDAIRIRRVLAQSATDWDEHGRDDSELYRGARLAAADDVAARLPLAPTEREFIKASRDLADRELAEIEQRSATQSRQNRRLRVLLGATALLLVAALVAGAVALTQRRRADRQTRQARAVSVSAEVDRAVAEVPQLLERDRSLALLLAVQAQRLRPDAATRGALLAALLREPRLRYTAYGGQDGYAWAAAFPDSERVALLGRDGADVWDLSTREPIGTMTVPDAAGISVSPDATLIATGSRSGKVTFWDTQTFRRVDEPLDAGAPVTDVAFVSDGQRLAVAVGAVQSTDPITAATTTQLWDVATRRPSNVLAGHAQSVNTLALSPDGGMLAAGDNAGLVVFHDPTTGEPIGPPLQLDATEGIYDLAFSPDGRWLAVGTFGRGAAGSAHVYEVSTRTEAAQVGSASLMVVAFSSGGTQLVTSGEIIEVWDTATWTPVMDTPIATQHGPATITSTSTGLMISGFDGTLSLWDPNGLPLLARVLADAPPAGGTFSPDGELVAVVGNDDTVAIRRADDLTALATLSINGPGARGFLDGSTPVAFSRDSRVGAIADRFGNVQLFDAASQRPSGASIAIDAVVVGLTFSPDGRSLIAFSNSSTVNGAHLIDVASHRVRGLDPPVPHALSATFRPDGKELVVTAATGGAWRYPASGGDIGKGTTLTVPGALPETATFSPDGNLLAIGRIDGTLSFFDAKTFEQVGRSVPVSSGLLASIAWSRDGRLVAAQDASTANHLIDVPQRARIGEPFPSHGLFGTGGFAPDGRTLILAGPHGTTIWDLDVARWPELACMIAGRDLTTVEWDTYFSASGNVRSTCPALER
jgi:WD40 repeat protein